MTRNGFVKIDDETVQIGEFMLEPSELLAFIRNFASIASEIEFVHAFIRNILNNTRWRTSDGLKWFLKGMIGIAEKDQMADILNDALEEVDQEKSTKVRYSYEPDPSFNSSKKEFKISKDIIAAMDMTDIVVDDFLNYLRKTIVVQSQQCQWIQLANGQKN